MNIEYFGWLTKGKYQVSLLDVLIMIAEFALVIFIAAIINTYILPFFKRSKYANRN